MERIRRRGLDWWSNHHMPYFFGWVWASFIGVAFIVGVILGAGGAISLLHTRGLL